MHASTMAAADNQFPGCPDRSRRASSPGTDSSHCADNIICANSLCLLRRRPHQRLPRLHQQSPRPHQRLPRLRQQFDQPRQPSRQLGSSVTGVALVRGSIDKRPYAIMIDNHPNAYPQSGLDKAAVVYEALAEFGPDSFYGGLCP